MSPHPKSKVTINPETGGPDSVHGTQHHLNPEWKVSKGWFPLFTKASCT